MFEPVGVLHTPHDCSCFYTYTSRTACMYGVLLEELVYKDLKTLICDMYPRSYSTRLHDESGDVECEFLSCEALMGKRGKPPCSWASVVVLHRNIDGSSVVLHLDNMRANTLWSYLGIKDEARRLEEALYNSIKRLQQLYNQCLPRQSARVVQS